MHVHEKLSSPTLKMSTINLIGFGGNRVCPLGYFEADLQIDDQFFTNVYVTFEHILKEPIIGQDLLKQVKFTTKECKISISNLNA